MQAHQRSNILEALTYAPLTDIESVHEKHLAIVGQIKSWRIDPRPLRRREAEVFVGTKAWVGRRRGFDNNRGDWNGRAIWDHDFWLHGGYAGARAQVSGNEFGKDLWREFRPQHLLTANDAAWRNDGRVWHRETKAADSVGPHQGEQMHRCQRLLWKQLAQRHKQSDRGLLWLRAQIAKLEPVATH